METIKKTTPLDKTLEEDAVNFYDALQELIRIYQFRDRDKICCHGISITQCYTLDALSRRSPITLKELASHLHLEKSTVSRVIGTMERKGLVQRRSHSKDQRSVLLVSTRKGKQLYERIREKIQENDIQLISEFPPDVRSTMIEFIARLAKNAEKRLLFSASCEN